MASSFNKIEMLDTLIKENEVILNVLKQKYLPLKEEVLNKIPAPGKWSINEIFQHLLVVEKLYLSQFEKIEQNWQNSDAEKFNSNWFGDLFTHLMSPKDEQVRYKMPAPSVVDPKGKFSKENTNPHNVIETLIAYHEQWIKYMNEAKNKEIENVKFKVAIPFFKLKLGDVFRVNTAHVRRHLIQARKNI